MIYISSVLEDLLNTVDDMYVDMYIEINQTDKLEYLKVHTDNYTDYISTHELIYMAERCALYDIDNHLSTKSFDQLTEEYYHLFTECLIDEYEKIYSHDFHLRHIDKIIYNHDDLKTKEIATKNKSNYSAMKNQTLKNNIVFERKIK